jgi:DNA-binding transcriptional ArsR family regulator
MAEWGFLTNHALVLTSLAKKPRITAREISLSIGLTERAVRKIIADLDDAGYITKKREGRRVRYRINPELSMRHESHQEIVVGDFLEALGWKRRRRRTKADAESAGGTEATSKK